MKLVMKKQKLKMTSKVFLYARQAVVGALLFVFFVGSFIAPAMVQADQFDAQINQLKADNAQKQAKVDALKVEAGSLKATIEGLQSQINGLQAQISANQAKNDALKVKIAEAEEELAKQKKLLGQNIKAMYLEGQITTLEMLASSKDLSEFVDKQQYRDAVKDKIKQALDKVTALKLQLKEQKEEVERLIKEQKALQNQIATQQAEQNRLLGLNESQQAATDQQIRDNYGKITELKRQQAIENAKRFGGGAGVAGGGGYPWGNAVCLHTGSASGPCPNYDWSFNGSIWNYATGGYGYRNCTDWVAWRVGAPSGLGNANTWDDRAPYYGYAVSGNPRVGTAAVSNSGFYGHVMFVEAVNGDGSIVISDYNRMGDGLYRISTLSAAQASYLVYVYF